MDAENYEPLYIPQDNILEECLRREAEKLAHQESVMNRVVYDCLDPSPNNLNQSQKGLTENEQINNIEGEEEFEINKGNPN